jgi:phosphopantothenoylcysteine decarboxylase/phosphopantothenate--cysteine ligase
LTSQRRVLIGIGGGISAYKIWEVSLTLAKASLEVCVILTKTTQEIFTPPNVSTLSRHPAYTDDLFWQPIHSRPLHIELGEWAEIFLIAPLTANTLGKLVYGLGDNLLTNTVLASPCPVIVAPAMNTQMWEQPSVGRNWQSLQQDSRYHPLTPGAGMLACDRVGTGRMAEPSTILTAIESLLYTQGQRDLAGKHILISAGGTQEYLDPVRFIGNPSTGKMGIALAQAARYRGANVTLVHAPINSNLLANLNGIRTLPILSAEEMHHTLLAEFPQADWTIMAAAVADVKPATTASHKLPKKDLSTALPLEFVPDIAQDLGQRKQPHQKLIGFAAQTGDIVTPAKEKLKRKRLDAIAANPIDQPNSGFGSLTNEITWITAQGDIQPLPSGTKLTLAHQLLDCIKAL